MGYNINSLLNSSKSKISSNSSLDILTSENHSILNLSDESSPLLANSNSRFDSVPSKDNGNDNDNNALDKDIQNQPKIYLLCITLFIFYFGFGLSLSPRVALLLNKICESLSLDPSFIPSYLFSSFPFFSPSFSSSLFFNSSLESQCNTKDAQVLVSRLESVINILMASSTVIISGKFGHLSDKFGRKPLILFNLFMAILSKFLVIYNLLPIDFNQFDDTNPLSLFNGSTFNSFFYIFAKVFECFGGGLLFLLSLSSSYITDLVSEKSRTFNLSLLGGSFYSGLAFGPLVGSLIVRYLNSVSSIDQINNNFLPCYIDIFFSILSFSLIFLLIPESNPYFLKNKPISNNNNNNLNDTTITTNNNTEKASLYESIIKTFNIFKPLKLLWIDKFQNSLNPRINVILLIIIDILIISCGTSPMPFIMFYTSYKLHWTSIEIGYFVSITGFSRAIILLFFTPFYLSFLKKILNFKVNTNKIDNIDKFTITICLVFETVAVSLMLLNKTKFFYLSALINGIGALTTPTIQSAIVKYAILSRKNKEKIGEIFSAMTLIRGIVSIVMPSTYLYIYSITVKFNPKFCFYIMLTFITTAFVLSLFLKEGSKNYHDDSAEDFDNQINIIEETTQNTLLLNNQEINV
ncbi:uncharacterized protein ASCRUDRAFT_76343 [Ascoidea rubescens DSM 1968]|uniref:MFS general substrate transporter n=1 Tax=Ascoidea rubescens DSM 1968 TaxID=1344418 RepID=A0A1D2VFA6_9ASCO|nr:MFS general substrate transporter [Ascoidea rubescens DSM 1968]ODV60341.1 MFS general substrate transporter [Ascoidea rubescens DSM 1968]